MADIEVYDPHNMIHENAHMVRDLEKSLQQDLRLQPAEFDKIMVSGMGGSAIGGDIVADALIRFPNIP